MGALESHSGSALGAKIVSIFAPPVNPKLLIFLSLDSCWNIEYLRFLLMLFYGCTPLHYYSTRFHFICTGSDMANLSVMHLVTPWSNYSGVNGVITPSKWLYSRVSSLAEGYK